MSKAPDQETRDEIAYGVRRFIIGTVLSGIALGMVFYWLSALSGGVFANPAGTTSFMIEVLTTLVAFARWYRASGLVAALGPALLPPSTARWIVFLESASAPVSAAVLIAILPFSVANGQFRGSPINVLIGGVGAGLSLLAAIMFFLAMRNALRTARRGTVDTGTSARPQGGVPPVHP